MKSSRWHRLNSYREFTVPMSLYPVINDDFLSVFTTTGCGSPAVSVPRTVMSEWYSCIRSSESWRCTWWLPLLPVGASWPQVVYMLTILGELCVTNNSLCLTPLKSCDQNLRSPRHVVCAKICGLQGTLNSLLNKWALQSKWNHSWIALACTQSETRYHVC